MSKPIKIPEPLGRFAVAYSAIDAYPDLGYAVYELYLGTDLPDSAIYRTSETLKHAVGRDFYSSIQRLYTKQ